MYSLPEEGLPEDRACLKNSALVKEKSIALTSLVKEMINQKIFVKGSATDSCLVYFALFAIFVTLPLQWFSLVKIFGLSLKPVHLSIGLAFLSALGLKYKMAAFRNMAKYYGPFVIFFLMFIVLMISSLVLTQEVSLAASIVIKSSTYFLIFILLSLVFFRIREDGLARLIQWVVPMGLLIFVIIAIYIFHTLKRNLLIELGMSVISEDASKLQHGFYPVLFNYTTEGSISQENAEYIGASLRNTLVGAFVIYITLLNSFRSSLKKVIFKGISVISVIAAAILILLSVSRSNIIVLMMIFSFAWLVRTLRSKSAFLTLRRLRILALLIVVIIFGIVLTFNYLVGLIEVISNRLTQLLHDNRVRMYENAINVIDENILIGRGLGTQVSSGGGKMFRIHNLFLSAWAELGILGLILSSLFYLSIVFVWSIYVLKLIRRPNSWLQKGAPEWIMTLPILPLFHTIVFADGGVFTLINWICLALFFAYISRNEAILKKMRNLKNQTEMAA